MGLFQSKEIPSKPAESLQKNDDSVDFYQLLEVDKLATEAELRKAYKLQALKLHPDRNFDKVEEATALFAKIQAAYDVLSDPQERAWYDSHGVENEFNSMEDENDIVIPDYVTSSDDLQKYFDPMLYSGLDNNNSDMFETIDSLFKKLGEEEYQAIMNQNKVGDYTPFPRFGNNISTWENTKHFYSSWLKFSSKKSFSWYDIYRISDAPDRKTMRTMENANQKSRDAARIEFDETVRTLARFIRKRDPRYKKHLKDNIKNVSLQTKSNLSERNRKTAWEAKQGYKEQEWEKNSRDSYDESDSDDNQPHNNKKYWQDADENIVTVGTHAEVIKEEVTLIFKCDWCNKSFKSKNQISEHEKSKKHIKTVQRIKWEMKKDNINFVSGEGN